MLLRLAMLSQQKAPTVEVEALRPRVGGECGAHRSGLAESLWAIPALAGSRATLAGNHAGGAGSVFAGFAGSVHDFKFA
jgi:hypothetical protein